MAEAILVIILVIVVLGTAHMMSELKHVKRITDNDYEYIVRLIDKSNELEDRIVKLEKSEQ